MLQNIFWNSVLLEWFKLVVDLLKSAAWPAGIVCIAYLLRGDLAALLSGAKISKGDIVLELQKQAVPHVGNIPKGLEDVPLPNPLGANGLALGPAPYRGVPTIEDGLGAPLAGKTGDQQIAVLKRELAIARIERYFELIFADIFQSQIVALLRLRASAKAVTLNDAVTYFENEVKAANPVFANVPFDVWFRYISITHQLVGNVAGVLTLTMMGEDFIDFMERAKRNYSKAN